VSGAAVASAMGRSGRWFATLLAVTGARLGTWLPNPGFIGAWSEAAKVGSEDWTVPAPPRLRRLPYLFREVLGIHRSADRLLQITDGGHYENLGLVELFRRRCTEIYCIDASGDSPPAAGTLAAALRLAEEELGVKVDLPDTSWELVPGSADPLEPKSPLAELNSRLSKQATVTATFTYPIESGLGTRKKLCTGRLVVAKALLTPDMDYNLLGYATNNPVFPHDSTGDQFFDDDKYCAYTALGREIGEQSRKAMKAARPGHGYRFSVFG
jgi:8-oxo-dGTP pyrophosphatase MutT (NUDIX family)